MNSVRPLLVVGLLTGLGFVARADLLGTGLEISVAGDILGRAGTAPGIRTPELQVREVEIAFYAPTDYLFDAALTAAAHREEGNTFFELHEAFVGSSRLIPRSRFRLGHFFLGVGKLNRVHRHDWPFSRAPKVHANFFDQEGVSDTGLEYSVLLPTPFFWELTVGITNGRVFGHSHEEGEAPRIPTHYARMSTFAGAEMGLNYLGRQDADRVQSSLLGFDLTYRKREGRNLEWLVQSETWLRVTRPSGGERAHAVGTYVFPQYGFTQQWLVGVRWDAFLETGIRDFFGDWVPNVDVALVPVVTFQSSEFAKFRLSYDMSYSWQQRSHARLDHEVMLQAVFILGAHPAHDY